MAKTIVWNNKASIKFYSVLDYLEKKWGNKVTQDFIADTLKTLDILSEYPEMGKIDNPKKQIRVFVITKHNTLFYRVDGNRIFLLNFFDNRQHPKKRSDI